MLHEGWDTQHTEYRSSTRKQGNAEQHARRPGGGVAVSEFNLEQLEQAATFFREGKTLALVACRGTCDCGGQWMIWDELYGPDEEDNIIAYAEASE